MQRWAILLTLGLCLWAPPAHADYFILKLDLNDFPVVTGGAAAAPMGMMPMMPMGGMPMKMGAAPVPLWIHACFEAERAAWVKPAPGQPSTFLYVQHRWGKTCSVLPEAVVYKHYPTKHAAKRLKDDKERNGTVDKLHLYALKSLQYGNLPEFHEAMKALEAKNAKHAAVVAYKEAVNQLKNELPRNERGEAELKEQVFKEKKDLYSAVSRGSKYYTILTMRASDKAVTTRLELLDQTYQSFFFWFALKGQSIEPPKQRLLVVLEKEPEIFQVYQDLYDVERALGDSFTAQRDNVIFLAGTRRDRAFTRLEAANNDFWQILQQNRDAFTLSKFDLKELLPQTKIVDTEQAKLQALCLIQYILEEESLRSTTTHEAIRQLLAATNLLPRDVRGVEWLRYGIASFFETGPLAMHPSFAMPSWTQLTQLKYHFRLQDKNSSTDADAVLRDTITDRIFHRAYSAVRSARGEPNGSPREQIARAKLEIARATSWALTYQLMNAELPQLLSYMQELRGLPRDLDLDANTLTGCFGRALDLVDAKSANPNQLDEKKTALFSSAWFRRMGELLFEIPSLELTDVCHPPAIVPMDRP